MKLATMIFVLLPLGGCPPMNGPSDAGPFLVHVGDDLVHQASGTVFPARVTGFQRVNGHVFSRDGRDIGVEYNLLGANGAMATIVATVYVYPAPSLVSIGSPDDVIAGARAKLTQMEFARRKREVESRHQGASLVEQSEHDLVQATGRLTGWKATYKYNLDGNSAEPLESQLFVFCFVHGPWALEYRFTYPQSLDASPAIDAFMRALRITI